MCLTRNRAGGIDDVAGGSDVVPLILALQDQWVWDGTKEDGKTH